MRSSPQRHRIVTIASCAAAVVAAGLPLLASAPAVAVGPCDPPVASPIACENSLPGNPGSEWDIAGAGDASIQGFATDISVNKGATVAFKVKTTANAYRLDIYRMGYYAGNGARKVTTVSPSVSLPQSQPACIDQSSTTGLVDCGNWAESASWAVPSAAVSGIYFAKLVRTDNGGASHIMFVVRDDASTAAMLFQTSDTTWQAYNSYGGNSLYQGSPIGRAYKVSYNRPFTTRGTTPESRDFVWANEWPMVKWMEANGYDVTYTTGIDSDRRGELIKNHKVFLSVGHDEYWSGPQRANVEAARDAGVNLAFFSGNAVFWKTRWETSVDGSGTPYRTLVTYKETKANAKVDPAGTSMWTGTWRDPRFSPPADGGRPENALMGTMFQVEGLSVDMKVPEADGKMRLWRNTSLATLGAGATATLSGTILGYEWDEDVDNGFRPAGLIRLSTTTVNVEEYLVDYGSTVAPGVSTHNMTMYRASSGALVFGAGTIQWSWGLDGIHDGPESVPDIRIKQATVNLFADMGVQPATLQGGLVAATKSTDTSAPTATITSPAPGATITNADSVMVTGTAVDAGGGRVGGVEVSTDGGATWHPATGRGTWTYPLSAVGVGAVTLLARATDDSGNIQAVPASVGVNVTCPCQLFSNHSQPFTASTSDAGAVEVGVKFRSDVDTNVTGIRFYKGTGNTGTHVGNLWNAAGANKLASATFSGESASGWQQVVFATPVQITAGTTYVASYFAPNGHYSADPNYFSSPVNSAPLHGLQNGTDGPNGVYRYGSSGGFPTESYGASNYWVDVIVSDNAGPDTTPPAVTGTVPSTGAAGVGTVTPVRATFSESVQPETVSLVLRDPANNVVPSSVAYDGPSRTATLTPNAALAGSTTFTATVNGAKDITGNTMAAPHVWSFTTGTPAGVCPCTIWDDAAAPASSVSGGAALELGVKFLSDADGSITGVRFYKGPGTAGTHTGSLWSSTGTRLATATFTSETASGWQQVSFSSPVAVTAGTTYVATYYSPTGAYVYSDGFFATAGVDSPPLHALANGADGMNGLYVYGTSGFPRQSYNSTNYWVDVVFVTSTSTPSTVPSPTSTTTTTTPPGPTTCPCTVWPASAVPATPAVADPSAVELGMKFRTDAAGYITGVRFYKGAGNTGAHVGSLWTAGGAPLASAPFTAETATGWQQVLFATPVAVTANTTYVVSYHTASGFYAGDGGFFNGAGVDRAPLHALASGADGPNGVYAYGAGGFPSQSYDSTNYWVDAVFVASLTTTTTSTTTSTSTTTTSTTSTTVAPTTTTTVAPTTTTTVAQTTTTTLAPKVFTDTATADFGGGSFGTGTYAAATAGGEVSLAPAAASEFNGTAVPSGWAGTNLVTGGSATVTGGALTVNGALAGTTSTYSRGRSLEFVATLSGAANQWAGFGVDFSTTQWAAFGTGTAGGALYARSRAGSSATDTTITGVTLGVPHRFRIDWNSTSIVYSVDGVVKATHTTSVSSSSLRPLISDSATTGGAVVVDWMRMTPYAASGTYTSKVFDATTSRPWGTATWTATVPAGTTLTVEVRTGSTATPGTSWTAWRTLSGSGASIAATSRYIQYRVVLVASGTNRPLTPTLSDITLRTL